MLTASFTERKNPPPRAYPWYDTKEHPVGRLKIQEEYRILILSILLLGPLWHGMIVSKKGPNYGEIDQFNNYLY